MKKLSVFYISLSILIIACIFVIAPSSFAAKALKIGIVDCYSGPPAAYTNDVRDAFKLEVDKINAAGGILGRKIEVLTRDSKFKVDLGLSAAKELIYRENVDIMMGTINSALALAISDMCKKEKVPFFVTFSKSAKITGAKGHRYVFSITENLTRNTGLPVMIMNTAMQLQTACGTTSKSSVRTWNSLASPGGR
jgi:branched-chain amino acid transport system substrate-binding protein